MTLAERLRALYPEASGRSLKQWLAGGRVTVDGRPCRDGRLALAPDAVVALGTRAGAAPFPRGLGRVHEDDAILVVVKPGGLLTIATERERERTVYRLLWDYLAARGERPFIVHRLDRETSGLMVFAKTPRAKETLQGGWDRVEKNYEAVVEGRLPQEQGTFESDLDETNPFKVFSTHASERTRHAVTHYRVLAKSVWRSLVALTLKTGRRHQIRVHLADAGCPIVGDEKYHAKSDPAKRLGLHACGLRFPHPETGTEMKFESPLPKDLARLVPLAKPAGG